MAVEKPFMDGKAAMALVLALLILPLIPSSRSAEIESDPRASSMVHFDIFSTRLGSDTVHGWENFMIGKVNRTTTVETQLVNDLDVPLSSIEVTCTIYWYEGNYPDRGHVVFKEMVLVDIEGGKDTNSKPIRFSWVPTISGAYIINVSAHVPGDARPMSTDPLFFQGRKYEYEPIGHFYSGIWIAKDYWNCSSLAGWTSSVQGGSEEEGWRPFIHPLGKDPDLQHSAPWTFFAGNSTTGLAPENGTYSLISPTFDLTGFSPDPFDVELGKRRPQIYLLFKYKGNLTPDAGDMVGNLSHWISSDDGATWDRLNDSRGEWVKLSGGTGPGTWVPSPRPPAYGSDPLIGIDLGAYIGTKVKVKIVLTPGALKETGYLLDDMALMGIERLDEVPFSIDVPEGPLPEVEPSARATFNFTVRTGKSQKGLVMRFGTVNASSYIDIDRDVTVDPEVLEVPPGSSIERNVIIGVSIAKGALSGNGHLTVRAIGGGSSMDLELRFLVKAIHKLSVSFHGGQEGTIWPGERLQRSVLVENSGNIQEKVDITFVTQTDLQWDKARRRTVMDPGDDYLMTGNLTVPEGTLSGPKVGFFVISPSPLPTDQEIAQRLGQGSQEPYWNVFRVELATVQFRSVRLISSATKQYIDPPPLNGSSVLTYTLFLVNDGNGEDLVHFNCSETGSREGIEVNLPGPIGMMPNETRVINVSVTLEFPILDGIYNITITACSSGPEDGSDNSVELVMVVGKPPVSRGLFLMNGSLIVRPESVVTGQEAIFFFKVRSFGYLQPIQFTVNLLINGVQVESAAYTSSVQGVKEYQIGTRFQDHGTKNISLALSSPIAGPEVPGELRRVLNMTLAVGYIDIAVLEPRIDGKGPERLNGTEPGEHLIQATVINLGNEAADLVTMRLEIVEASERENRTVILINITGLNPDRPTAIEHIYRFFKPMTTYHITISFEDRGLWKEANNTNDLQTMLVEFGQRPPETPFWREPLFIYVSGGLVLLALLGLSYILIRRNL